jgi:hypothetical protein
MRISIYVRLINILENLAREVSPISDPIHDFDLQMSSVWPALPAG